MPTNSSVIDLNQHAQLIKNKISALPGIAKMIYRKSNDAYSNELAKIIIKDKQILNDMQPFINSVKLCVTEENLKIITKYFNAKKREKGKMPDLYNSFAAVEDFILRLYVKRYKSVYLDGRMIYLRNNSRHTSTSDAGKLWLRDVGSITDSSYYKEYLTLEELVFSALIIPQVTSIIIGTGYRPKTQFNNLTVVEQLNHSINIACISYPAAAEFRGGATVHYDLYAILRPYASNKKAVKKYKDVIDAIKEDPALLQAMVSIYGKHSYVASNSIPGTSEVNLDNGYYISIPAYRARTINLLTSLLLSSDQQMQEHNLGKTFQLKGLGLGAFAFNAQDTKALKILQELYIYCVKAAVCEVQQRLSHINHINIINLPSSFRANSQPLLNLKELKSENFNITISVSTCNMNPSNRNFKANIGEIGGISTCGDSGSFFGNEGNIGFGTHSSDNPATQISLAIPDILNPDENDALNKNCIFIISNEISSLDQCDTPIITNNIINNETNTFHQTAEPKRTLFYFLIWPFKQFSLLFMFIIKFLIGSNNSSQVNMNGLRAAQAALRAQEVKPPHKIEKRNFNEPSSDEIKNCKNNLGEMPNSCKI